MTSEADASSPDDDLDEGTLFVRRAGAPTQPADTGADEAADADADADDATRWSRRSAAGAGIHQPMDDIDAETGSTMVVRRETRRRAEAAAREAESDVDMTVAGAGARPLPATVAGDVPAPLQRRAHAPHPADAVYEARRDQPPVVSAQRAARPIRIPQAPIDGVASETIARRRGRRRAIIVVVVASTVVIVAVAAVVVLAFAG